METSQANRHPREPQTSPHPPTPFRIEPVTWSGIRAVAEIQKRSFPKRLAYGWGALATLRVWPGVVFLIAKDRETNTVMGCIIGDRAREAARVMNLAIHPDYRRRGLGRALLQAFGESLPDGDVTLMVQDHNSAAQALYAAEGFLRSGTIPDYYGKGEHGVVMRKPRYPATNRRTMIS